MARTTSDEGEFVGWVFAAASMIRHQRNGLDFVDIDCELVHKGSTPTGQKYEFNASFDLRGRGFEQDKRKYVLPIYIDRGDAEQPSLENYVNSLAASFLMSRHYSGSRAGIGRNKISVPSMFALCSEKKASA